MVQDTKVSGKMTKPTGKESLSTLMEMSTKVSGLTTRLKERALTHMQMEPTMKENGSMISNTASELNPGQTVLATKDHMRTVRKKAKVVSLLLMVLTMRASLGRTRFPASGTTTGLMESLTTVSGLKASNMVKLYLQTSRGRVGMACGKTGRERIGFIVTKFLRRQSRKF